MCVSGKARRRISAVVVTACAWTLLAWTTASAEPVRITVSFRVAGDHDPKGTTPADPVHGWAEARGSFSIVTQVPAGGGQIEDFARGLGADAVSFSWAGTRWTTRTADVSALVFDPHGTLVYWQLAGVPAGLGEISRATAPDIYLDPFAFLYVTPRSMYQGRVMSTTELRSGDTGGQTTPGSPHDPDPVPEPIPFALVASGLVALAGRQHVTRH
ncbi:MAG: hypothetical protein V7647_3590 [Acidobacteriota bacterium]